MKKIFAFCWLCVAVFAPLASAQYTGGLGDGYHGGFLIGTSFPDFVNFYAGGPGDGYDGGFLIGTSFPDFVNFYAGGPGDGYDSDFLLGLSFPINQSPIADAGEDQTYECADPDGTLVTLDGSGSSDPDDDDLTYTWRENDTVIAGPTLVDTVEVTLPPGQHTIELTVDDGNFSTDTDDVVVTILANTAPTLAGITAPLEPVQVGTAIDVSAAFTDPDDPDAHTAVWTWNDGATCDTDLEPPPADCAVDQDDDLVTGTHTYTEAGVYTLHLTLSDHCCDADEAVFQYVVVFDPEGGFVTGGGWIDSPEGAYVPDPSLTGKAHFGFVSKYKKGKSQPTGQTQFQFKAGDLNFHSSSYDWLVVSHHKAKYKGTGTINGAGHYGFLLSAIDEALTPSTDVDLFRIKLWDKDDGDAVVYDNLMDAPEDADPTTALGGGNINIHDGKAKSIETAGLEASTLAQVPAAFGLSAAYPNPFNPQTALQVSVPEAGPVRLVVYDVLGRRVRVLVEGELSAGMHAVVFEASAMPSGVYVARLETPAGVFTRTMLLMK